MHSALQAPLLLPIVPDLPHSCSPRDGKGTGEGAGICRMRPASVPQVGSPCAPACWWPHHGGPSCPSRVHLRPLEKAWRSLHRPFPWHRRWLPPRPACPLSAFPGPCTWILGPTGPSSSLQWPPLGPSCHPRADCWQSCSLSLMQARAAFAFSFLQLRGRCQSLFHPQDGLSAWTHSHGVQSSRRCYSGATPRHVHKLGNDMPISPLTDDSSLLAALCDLRWAGEQASLAPVWPGHQLLTWTQLSAPCGLQVQTAPPIPPVLRGGWWRRPAPSLQVHTSAFGTPDLVFHCLRGVMVTGHSLTWRQPGPHSRRTHPPAESNQVLLGQG